jgi:DNA ligase (NAD+)
MNGLDTLEGKFKYLEELGFGTPGHEIIKIKDIPRIYEFVMNKRNHLNYNIDGLVFSINNIEKMESLGFLRERGKPKGQIALKFPPEQCFSKIQDILFSFRGTQDIGLVAIMEPIEVLGVMITKASLKRLVERGMLSLK